MFAPLFRDFAVRFNCVSTCCRSTAEIKNGQLNGLNGEFTNSDDRKTAVQEMHRVEQKVASLTRKISQMLPKPKPKKKKVAKRTKAPAHPFPGIPGNVSFDQETPIAHPDPLVKSIVAQIDPFRTPRGTVAGLTDARPSQKFTARALLSFTVPASQLGVMSVCPCIASNANLDSAGVFFGAKSALDTQLKTATTLAAGVTFAATASNTPYDSFTLRGKDFSWRLVSCGVRIRNTTSQVNRQGVVQMIFDYNRTLLPYGTNYSIGSIVDAMTANHRTIRKNTSNEPDIDLILSASATRDGWSEVADPSAAATASGALWAFFNQQLIPDGTNYIAHGGGYVVFPSTGAAQTYDIEIIEHWEVHGTTIETLHTPSPSHSQAAELVSSIVQHAHHQHSLTPSGLFHRVAKAAVGMLHNKAALKQAGEVATALALL